MQRDSSSGAAVSAPPTYVVGDVHGHRAELLTALRGNGLVDEAGDWAGGRAHLWFLGDFVDRGPDGVGVIDLVMTLAEQAGEAGGLVQALLGNHEILLLGMHRFGDTDVPSDFGPRSFARSWQMNGGQVSDQEALTGEHIDWLVDRPVLALVGDQLLMHSDTTEYLGWGAGIEEVNESVRAVLRSEDLVQWWEVWRRMTTRYAFRGPHGEQVATDMLTTYGGSLVVHGHSVIADQLGIMPAQVEGPCEYAGGKALGVDAGLFVGGPCLVVPLPWRGGDVPATEDSPAEGSVAEGSPAEESVAEGSVAEGAGSTGGTGDTDPESAEATGSGRAGAGS